MEQVPARWAARVDLLRPQDKHSFDDLARIVATYFEMYRAVNAFLGPWNAKQVGSTFPYQAPEREQLRLALGGTRPWISDRARTALIESAINFCVQNKGKRQLITPNPVTHHSAQFAQSAFSLTKTDDKISLYRPQGTKQPSHITNVISLSLAGATAPVYIENLTIKPEQVGFVIVRPRLGKLGTPNLSRWEALLYRQQYGYLIEHVDSELNPRYCGTL
jgi:hypothetical protein